MPSWISIYCTQPIGEIDLARLRNEIADNDYWTLAEQYDVDEDLVRPALARLQIEPEISGFGLHYRPDNEHPLVIHFWHSPERVKEEIEEVFETLDDVSNTAVQRIRAHMLQVKSVIGIELGASQPQDMGIVFAYEVARWFGKHRYGLIKGDDDAWSRIEGGGYAQV